jgi:hypothetical protein
MSADLRHPGDAGSSSAATHCRAFTEQLGEIGGRVHRLADGSRNDALRAEINQHMLSALHAAVPLTQLDPDYPDWALVDDVDAWLTIQRIDRCAKIAPPQCGAAPPPLLSRPVAMKACG